MRLPRVLPLLLLGLSACASPGAGPTDPEAWREGPLAELLSTPLPADGACGPLHQKVDTENPSAQALYDQGMACLATFDWARAARSFRGALAQDAALAAAYAGLGRAYLGLEAPAQALHWARQGRARLEPSTAPYDGAWVRLAVRQLEAVVVPRSRRPRALEKLRQGLDRFLEDFPSDPHALALRGHAERRADDWGQGGGEASAAWYSAALEADPEYFPAHHFLAHALENQGLYGDALHHARRFAELAPEAPHAHHMVAHTAPRSGLWQEALEALETADALHQERFVAGEIPRRADWHYAHNLRLMAAVALHQGEPERARGAYRRTFELDIPGHRGGYYCGPWIEFLLWQGDPGEALEASESCLERPSLLAKAVAAAYRGEALAALGRLPEARRQEKEATEALRRVFDSLGPVSTEVTTAAAARRTLAVLRGKLAVLDGDRQAGAAALGALVEDLAGGRSFDAWASAQSRLRELRDWARAREIPRLVHRLDETLHRLEGSLSEAEVALLEGGAAACH